MNHHLGLTSGQLDCPAKHCVPMEGLETDGGTFPKYVTFADFLQRYTYGAPSHVHGYVDLQRYLLAQHAVMHCNPTSCLVLQHDYTVDLSLNCFFLARQ